MHRFILLTIERLIYILYCTRFYIQKEAELFMTKKISKRNIEIKEILENDKNYSKETNSSMTRARANVNKIEKEVLEIHNKIRLLI